MNFNSLCPKEQVLAVCQRCQDQHYYLIYETFLSELKSSGLWWKTRLLLIPFGFFSFVKYLQSLEDEDLLVSFRVTKESYKYKSLFSGEPIFYEEVHYRLTEKGEQRYQSLLSLIEPSKMRHD